MKASTILQILDRQPGAYFQVHCEGYAEPGYTDPESGMIATGDWNSRQVRRRIYPDPLPSFLTVANPNAIEEVTDNTMPRTAAILEKLGVELEWEDEWCECSECRKLVRTEPNSYSWTRSYWLHDGIGLYCQACVLDCPEDYLEYLEGNPRAANALDLDLSEHEYMKTEGEYENGFHPGQNDNPETIAESLRKLGINRFIFDIDGVGQFSLGFSVWVHKSEHSKLGSAEIESEGIDVAAAMQTALRTAPIRLVSQQDFIDGKILN